MFQIHCHIAIDLLQNYRKKSSNGHREDKQSLFQNIFRRKSYFFNSYLLIL